MTEVLPPVIYIELTGWDMPSMVKWAATKVGQQCKQATLTVPAVKLVTVIVENKMADELHLLSDEELRLKLRYFNLPDGPITRTTRKLFEKKLERALKAEAGVAEPDCGEKPGVNRTDTESEANNSSEKDNDSSTEIGTVTVNNVSQDLKNESASTFYGVCIQDDEQMDSNCHTPLVFTDKYEALDSAKRNSGARFKAFSNRNEAEAFAYGNQATPRQVSPVNAPIDPIGKYKAPKPAEISQFRKLIETGDLGVGYLSELIYHNPKYLISSGDTPVILQEGFRYNAMHVAAKAGRKDVCELIVNTLGDNVFWNLIYPNSLRDQDVSRIRKSFVLDLYLNAPDKGFGETPLHFACKYGKADVVQCLLSYPGIDKVPKNKYGDTPQQVICSRVSECPCELRSRIEKMFTKEESFFVPILRAEDNCSFPKLGVPSPDLVISGHIVDRSSPEDPQYKISAYAGPMSPQEADKFCFILKSPRATAEEQMKFRNIKRSDSEKGLERVARKVAKSRNVGWCEYWKFLHKFTDFSTKDGLVMLEEYLRNKKTTCNSQVSNWNSQQSPVSRKVAENTAQHDINHSNGDCVFYDGYSTLSEQQTPTGRNPNILKSLRNRLSYEDDEECPSLGETEIRDGKGLLTEEELDSSKDSLDSDITDLSHPNRQVVCKERLKSKNGERVSEKPRMLSQVMDKESIENPYSRQQKFVDEENALNVSNSSEDSLLGLTTELERLHLSSGTPCRKVENKKCVQLNTTDLVTNPRISSETAHSNASSGDSNMPLFIEGFQPSKVDVDVLRAIKSVEIDPDIYPNISRWQKTVRSFPKSARNVWPGTGSPRFLQSRKRISMTWSC